MLVEVVATAFICYTSFCDWRLSEGPILQAVCPVNGRPIGAAVFFICLYYIFDNEFLQVNFYHFEANFGNSPEIRYIWLIGLTPGWNERILVLRLNSLTK